MVIVSATKNLTYVKTIFYYFIITLLQIQAMQVLIMLGNECLGLNFYRYGLSVRHPCSIESLCHVIYDTKCAEISALYLFKCSVISGGVCGGTLVCGHQCWYSASVRNYPLALSLRCSVIPACADLGSCRVSLV